MLSILERLKQVAHVSYVISEEGNVFYIVLMAFFALLIAGSLFISVKAKELNSELTFGGRVLAVALSVLSLIITGFFSIYSQSPGQASVVVSLSGKVVEENYSQGFAFIAPWNSRVEFDLFSRQLRYGGSNGEAPAYLEGDVQGGEITASVAGGVNANFDLSITYNLNGQKVSEIYEKYKSQENFTKQVIVQRSLATLRSIPPSYSPADFRGDKRAEAQQKMYESLKKELSPYGIEVLSVSLQNIRYEPGIEDALKGVEVARQNKLKAKEELEVATTKAQEKVVVARAEAEANQILSNSLDSKVLQKEWIEAIKTSGRTIVVPDSSAPLINLGVEQK